EAEQVPTSRPFVVIVGPTDWNNIGLIGHTVRAALPPDRLAAVYLYVGTPQDYEAQRPIDSDVSRSFFRTIQPLYPRHPIAFELPSYDPQGFGAWIPQHADTEITPRMAVLDAPAQLAPLHPDAPPVGRFAWWKLGLVAVGSILLLALIGLGWALWVLRRWLRPAEILGGAPAGRAAAPVGVGSAADRIGVRARVAVGAAACE